MFVIGISSIFTQQNLSSFVSGAVKELFSHTVTMLKIIQAIERADAERKQMSDQNSKKNHQILTAEEITESYLTDFKM